MTLTNEELAQSVTHGEQWRRSTARFGKWNLEARGRQCLKFYPWINAGELEARVGAVCRVLRSQAAKKGISRSRSASISQ